MTNSYFNHTQLIARFTTADAVRLNNILTAIQSGFDKLPSADELNQGSRNFVIATGTANTYAATVPFSLTSYSAGLNVRVLIMIANTGSSTLNLNSLGQVTIKRADGANLLAGDIRASSLNDFTYDGSNFRLMSFHGASEAITTANAATATTASNSAAASASSAATSATLAATSAATATGAAGTANSILLSARFGIRNLILNPLFWVSQRLGAQTSGQSYTYSAGTYFRDRWKAGPSGITFSIANQTLTITTGSAVQVVQGRNMHFNGSYTLSWTGTSAATVNNAPVPNGTSISLPAYENATISFSTGTVTLPQFEWGASKSSFEVRPNDIEKQMCYQYYQKSYAEFEVPGVVQANGAVYGYFENAISFSNCTVRLAPRMRATPTVTIYSPATGATGMLRDLDGAADRASVVLLSNDQAFSVFASSNNFITGNRGSVHWTASAEL